MIKQLLQHKQSFTATSPVAQLDYTGIGMSGNIHHPEGCLSKSIWSDQNNFGHIEGQDINLNWIKSYNIILANNIFFHAWNASFQGCFTEVSFGTSHSGPTLVA